MPKQPVLPSLGGAMKKKQTRRALFLVRMGAVVPRAAAGADRAALSESRVKRRASADAIRSNALGLRPADWYCCSHPMADESLDDSDAMRRFARIELGGDRISDDAVILHFPHMPKRHGLNKAGARDQGYLRPKRGAIGISA